MPECVAQEARRVRGDRCSRERYGAVAGGAVQEGRARGAGGTGRKLRRGSAGRPCGERLDHLGAERPVGLRGEGERPECRVVLQRVLRRGTVAP